MEITPTNEMLEVVTYEGEFYYIPRNDEADFCKALEENRFVRLQGEMVATRSIRKVRPVREQAITSTLTKEQRERLHAKCVSYRKNLGKEPTNTHIAHWVDIILSGKTLM